MKSKDALNIANAIPLEQIPALAWHFKYGNFVRLNSEAAIRAKRDIADTMKLDSNHIQIVWNKAYLRDYEYNARQRLADLLVNLPYLYFETLYTKSCWSCQHRFLDDSPRNYCPDCGVVLTPFTMP